jgi:hypothetical protein
MANDSLARGDKSALFGPPKVSQEKWDAIWRDDDSVKSTQSTSPQADEPAKDGAENVPADKSTDDQTP